MKQDDEFKTEQNNTQDLAIQIEPVKIKIEAPATFEYEHFMVSPKVEELESCFIKSEFIDCQSIEPPLQCDICRKCASTKEELVTHRYSHTLDTTYTCCICFNTHSNKTALQYHILMAHLHLPISVKKQKRRASNKSHQCDFCPKRFTHPSTLAKHMRTHSHERPFVCDLCPKSYKDRTGLVFHRRTHTGEKPYECDICHRRFNQRVFVTNHILTHTGEKPFECDICHKKCATKSNLTSHLRSHTERPFGCEICHKRYKKNTLLIGHRKKKHNCKVLRVFQILSK